MGRSPPLVRGQRTPVIEHRNPRGLGQSVGNELSGSSACRCGLDRRGVPDRDGRVGRISVAARVDDLELRRLESLVAEPCPPNVETGADRRQHLRGANAEANDPAGRKQIDLEREEGLAASRVRLVGRERRGVACEVGESDVRVREEDLARWDRFKELKQRPPCGGESADGAVEETAVGGEGRLVVAQHQDPFARCIGQAGAHTVASGHHVSPLHCIDEAGSSGEELRVGTPLGDRVYPDREVVGEVRPQSGRRMSMGARAQPLRVP